MAAQMQTATPEQIQAFKAGAARRYQERGIPYEKAEALFGAYMAKQAELAELTPAKPSPTAVKLAAFLKSKIKASVKK